MLLQPTLCKGEVCRGSYIAQCAQYDTQSKEANKEEAEKFLRDFYTIHDRQEITSQNTTLILEQYLESKVKCDSKTAHIRAEEFPSRWSDVLEKINRTGTYDLTHEELSYGVKAAWRNAPRCSARIQWKNLVCF